MKNFVIAASLLVLSPFVSSQSFSPLNSFECLYPNEYGMPYDTSIISSGNIGSVRTSYNTFGYQVAFPSTGTNMVVRHMGKLGGTPTFSGYGSANEIIGGVSTNATWNVSAFTGLSTSSANQKARYGTLAQTNAYQMDCYKFGALNNSYTYQHDNVYGGGPNISYLHQLPSGTKKVWADHDELALQVSNLKLPWVGQNAAAATLGSNGVASSAVQLSLQTILKDNTTGQYFHYIVLMFDNRSAAGTEASRVTSGLKNNQLVSNCSDVVAKSSADEYFVSTLIGNRSCYSTKKYSNVQLTSSTWSSGKFARIHITRQNLIDAINRLNSVIVTDPSKQLSLNVDNYSVENYALFQESLFGSPAAQLSIGFSGSHLMAYGVDY